VVEVVLGVRNLEKAVIGGGGGINFPQNLFGGATSRMTSSDVGFLQARSRDQGLVVEENECCVAEKGREEVYSAGFQMAGRESDVSKEARRGIEDLKILDRILNSLTQPYSLVFHLQGQNPSDATNT
jgi:hypothetical protein